MPREPDPINDPELFDAIELGGVRSPGTVKLSGHDRLFNWDVKAGAGQTGASTTLKDVPPRPFKAAFYLADDDDIAAWPAFRDHVNTTISGTTPKALDVYHPDLAANGFKSVVLANFGGVVHDGKGGQSITIEFQEYAPPKPKGGSPSGSSSKPKKKDDPNAAALAELASLTDQYKRTPWGDGATRRSDERER